MSGQGVSPRFSKRLDDAIFRGGKAIAEGVEPHPFKASRLAGFENPALGAGVLNPALIRSEDTDRRQAALVVIWAGIGLDFFVASACVARERDGKRLVKALRDTEKQIRSRVFIAHAFCWYRKLILGMPDDPAAQWADELLSRYYPLPAKDEDVFGEAIPQPGHVGDLSRPLSGYCPEYFLIRHSLGLVLGIGEADSLTMFKDDIQSSSALMQHRWEHADRAIYRLYAGEP